MIAFKWLAAGAVSPFRNAPWPRDGRWLSAPQPARPGAGVHACRGADLSWWICDELWKVELAGDIVEREGEIESQRGRLLEPVARWNPAAFAEACSGRAAEFARKGGTAQLAQYRDIAAKVGAATAAYIACVAASLAHGSESAFAGERAWQSRWILGALSLQE